MLTAGPPAAAAAPRRLQQGAQAGVPPRPEVRAGLPAAPRHLLLDSGLR